MNSIQKLDESDAAINNDVEHALLELRQSFLEQQEALISRERALEERLFRLETMINNVPANLYMKDTLGRFVVTNPSTRKCHNLDVEDTLIGKTDFDLYEPVIAQEFFDLEQDLMNSERSMIGVEQEAMTADGRTRSMLVSKIPVRDATGRPAGIVGFSYDISDQKEAEALMLGHANMFGMLARAAPLEEIVSSILLLVEEKIPGAIGSMQMLSPDGLQLLEPIGPNLPDVYRNFLAGMAVGPADPCNGTAVWSGDTEIIDDITSNPVWSDFAETAASARIRSSWAVPVLSYKGEVLGAFFVYTSTAATPSNSQSDLIAMASYMLGTAIERKHSEERIQFLAHHDPLTGLVNRAMFHERLKSALEIARQNGTQVALAFLDLDKFKLINDTLGHDAGDQLLKTVAERATASCRKSDTIARLGGDEFVIIFADLMSDSKLDADMFHHLQKAIGAPVTLCNQSVQIYFSMGVACFPDDGETPETLIANADIAMYQAKASGRNAIKIFSPAMAKFRT